MEGSPALGPVRTLRVAIVADLLEERWPSMDIVADSLLSQLGLVSGIEAQLLRPPLRYRTTAGRYFNRFVRYAAWLRPQAGSFDIFHVVDHSYAHLVHVLPPARTVVTCHDVDAFLPLVERQRSTSSLPPFMVRVLRSGLRKAARVACVSEATRNELLRYGILQADRLTVVPNGISPVFFRSPEAAPDCLDRFLGPPDSHRLDLLHVGTTIPRKRIEMLLRILHATKQARPNVRLIKAGGRFAPSQRAMIRELALGENIVEMPFLREEELAVLYRRATLLVLPSEREGFGLPIVEAMACGTRVVMSDLPVFREIAGPAGSYCPLHAVDRWVDTILHVAGEQTNDLLRHQYQETAVRQAGKFSWDTHARTVAAIYRAVAGGHAYGQDTP